MVHRSYVFLALLTMLCSSACGGDDPPAPTGPAATATEAQAATPSVNVHPRGTRTGRQSIDAALEAVERADPARLTSILAFVSRPCSTQAGFAIVCGTGQIEGTLVDIVVFNQCQPGQSQVVFRNAAPAAVATFVASRPIGLYAVSNVGTSPYHGPYGIAYASGHAILLDDAGVTGLLMPCGAVPNRPQPLGERHILAPP